MAEWRSRLVKLEKRVRRTIVLLALCFLAVFCWAYFAVGEAGVWLLLPVVLVSSLLVIVDACRTVGRIRNTNSSDAAASLVREFDERVRARARMLRVITPTILAVVWAGLLGLRVTGGPVFWAGAFVVTLLLMFGWIRAHRLVKRVK